jgi:CubicO group peptidase (beta-lactamase class C family)
MGLSRNTGSVGSTGIDDALARAVSAGEVAGVVAAVTNSDGVTYEGAFGQRSVGGPAPMSLDTLFRIFSMTKPVTTVAALQLVEEGKLDLDEPLGHGIPEVK